MGRARCAIAARAGQDALVTAMLDAFGTEILSNSECEDFDGVLDISFAKSEELGGDDGSDVWHLQTIDKWSVIGDLSMNLCKDVERLEALSEKVGELVVTAIDTSFEYAFFAYLDGGETKRLLILEDEEITEDGFSIAAERGRPLEDFSEEEAERLWTSFGLPTFDYDPLGGPFKAIAVQLT